MNRLAALLLLGALAAPAMAQEPPQDDKPQEAKSFLELTVETDRAEVPVGDAVKVTVRLKNAGTEPVKVRELAEDVQLVSFDLRLDDGPTFSHYKIHPTIYAPKPDWKVVELAAGEAKELTVELPALTTGVLTITANYDRAVKKEQTGERSFEPAKHVSKPVTVKLAPSADGHERVEVVIHTNLGPMHARLFSERTLGTALHFARLIRDGRRQVGDGREVPFYDGLTFHRVIENFMIQGGCPEGTGNGGPGYTIPAETAPKGDIPAELKHAPGRLAMARSPHRDSAGSQFYICVGAPSHLDGDYTVFGELTRGLDVARTIAEVPKGGADKPLTPVTIDSITLRTAPDEG